MSARVLVVGGGGREHALVWALARSARVGEVMAVPGNPGMAAIARCLPDPGDVHALAELAARRQVDLVVVGPEAPLAGGLGDALRRAGVAVYGPPAAAARLESSKAFAKDFMVRHRIPTARHATFGDAGAALEYVCDVGTPIVVKASSLAAGKGVTLAFDVPTAERAVEQVFALGHDPVVVEELLVGQEASLLVVTDGRHALPLPLAQDYKQVLDGDQGPMTGGMGAVAPVELLDAEGLSAVMATVVEPTLEGMRREGAPLSGTLFVGLMLTDDGPKVLEYNVRFGDPETQVVLPLLTSDLFELLHAAAHERLASVTPSWRPAAAACVVLASPGYPGPHRAGVPIEVPDDLGDDVLVFHAGTALADGRLVSSGGRVLGVTAIADDREAAVRRAYRAVDAIGFPGAVLRRDVGARLR